MIKSLKNNPKQIPIIIIVILLVEYAVYTNSTKKEPKKEKETKQEVFKCKSDSTYMTEYENQFNKIYPYGHSVSGINWENVRETDTECQYHTSIKITNENGTKETYDLFITTFLDKENKKEHVKSLIINNQEVWQ